MKTVLIFVLLSCIITFTVCSVKQPSDRLCVSDEYTVAEAPAFSFSADIPDDAVALTGTDGDCVLYEQGDYEILQEVFSGKTAADGLRRITGKSMEELSVICLSAFPQEEYRFSWTAAGESGDLTCCGVMLYDGSTCYSLTFQCPAQLENRYRNVFYHVISNVRLEPV